MAFFTDLKPSRAASFICVSVCLFGPETQQKQQAIGNITLKQITHFPWTEVPTAEKMKCRILIWEGKGWGSHLRYKVCLR